MVEYPDILEMQHSVDPSPVVHSEVIEPGPITLQPLTLSSWEVVKDIAARYGLVKAEKMPVAWFQLQLTQLNTCFREVIRDEESLGVIFLTDVDPTFSAAIHLIFWDGKLGKERREVVKEFVQYCFNEFELTRIQASIPETNLPLLTFLQRADFKQEGVLRRAWRGPGGDQDVHILSVLKGEA